MKLNKKKLSNIVGQDLIGLGYKKFEDGFFGSDGLFIKQVSEGLFLTLGLTISKFYESSFTGSYYLSKSTRWGAVWGDIPKESYKRISFFITDEEKKSLFDEADKLEGLRDAWWDAFNTNSVMRFLHAVRLSEKRFVEQPMLIQNVENSIDGNMLAEYISTVHSLFNIAGDIKHDFKFIPPNQIKNIPIEWFKAAELAIIKNGSILNANTVKLLAADAWFVSKMNL